MSQQEDHNLSYEVCARKKAGQSFTCAYKFLIRETYIEGNSRNSQNSTKLIKDFHFFNGNEYIIIQWHKYER